MPRPRQGQGFLLVFSGTYCYLRQKNKKMSDTVGELAALSRQELLRRGLSEKA